MKEIITDGGSITAQVAFNFSEVVPIYPITPSTPMAEKASVMSVENITNILGEKVKVIEMQSEAGVSGVLHGALLTGATATSFTSSQGLLLMIPNMYKIAGEGLPCVLHVSARSIATHALNIFCDHSDVMATRMTGFNMICASSVQECQDCAFISHALALNGGGATMHFFDGFRTSHEIQKILPLEKEIYTPFIDKIKNNKLKFSSDTSQFGTAQNPDVFFQGRENTVTLHEENLKEKFNECFDYFYSHTGRKYNFFEYYGDNDAKQIVVSMGSSCEAIEEYLQQNKGKKIGLIKVRVYRPFYQDEFLKVLPSTVEKICVLDRTKESGSEEPLALDVMATLQKAGKNIKIITGRYGLGGKDFSPSQIDAVFNNLSLKNSKTDFAVGIVSNVERIVTLAETNYTHKSEQFEIKAFGLGSDGTVSASKSTIKILGKNTDKFIQGYFEYDSKKSGSLTISHLRLSKMPIKSSYLSKNPNIISINNFSFIHKYNCLEGLQENGIVLINSIFNSNEIGKVLPKYYINSLKKANAKLYIIDANKIAFECGLKDKINIIMQTALFKATGILDEEVYLNSIKEEVTNTFARKGESVIQKNIKAISLASESLVEIDIQSLTGKENETPVVPDDKFYQEIMKPMAELRGNDIPAEKIGAGAPIGTASLEKRNIAKSLPKWIKENCVQCGQCVLACPHSALRAILVENNEIDSSEDFANAIGLKEKLYKIQLSPEDCTGCGVCARTCPAIKKALEMTLASEILDEEKEKYNKSLTFKQAKQTLFSTDHAKGLQFEKPYFEFSGACAGCGETPYIKILSMLFKDNLTIANATGCSSIYCGTFGSCPFAKDENGKGIKWANSLFEDNAEFGLGMKLGNTYTENSGKSTWIIGGDGWAYDIGYGGLDHILASGENVNILVLDNETYSNTGGQSSKSTPMGSNVKLAENGRRQNKKNLGQIAMIYPNVYVAQVALGANMSQCIKAFKEAEAHNGVSIIIAYSPCINQGFDLANMIDETKKAVECGYFPIYRYNPESKKLYLDSKMNEEQYFEFLKRERRYQITLEKYGEELLQEQKNHSINNYQKLITQSDDD